MKYLKYYYHIVPQPDLFESDMIEDVPNQPKIGDYAICEEQNEDEDQEIRKFISNNIGQLMHIDHPTQGGKTRYYIKYENIPTNIKDNYFNFENVPENCEDCRFMYRPEILIYSPDKENIEQYILNNKFNL